MGRRAHMPPPGSRRRRPPIRAFVDLALAGSLSRTTALALDYLVEARSRVAVFADLFDGAQRYIEDRWHVGYATSKDELRVSRAVEAALAALPEPASRPIYEPPPEALLLTMRREEHDLGLRLVATALADEGWKVDVALRIARESISAQVLRHRPDLVAISATFVAGTTRFDLAAIVADLRAAHVPVILGGSAFVRNPDLAQFVGADAVMGDARLAVRAAGRLAQVHQRRFGRHDIRKVS